MTRKDKVDLERTTVTKTVRTAIRLKHSIAADEEINAALPQVLEQFERAVAEGRPFQLEVGSVFEAYLPLAFATAK